MNIMNESSLVKRKVVYIKAMQLLGGKSSQNVGTVKPSPGQESSHF